MPGRANSRPIEDCRKVITSAFQRPDLIKVLTRSGWVHSQTKVAITSSRRTGKTVTVSHPRKDLGVGLVKAILKQAGIE